MAGNSGNEQGWLEFHDEAVTAVTLMAQIEARLKRRREAHDRITPQFPTFGYISAMPEPPTPQNAPNLYYHLRQLNQMDTPETTAVLVPTSSTRRPIIGRFWRLVRQQFHHLILFYVNRSQAYNSRANYHLVSVLNELTRLIQAQQQEIERLQTALDENKREA